MTKYNVTFYTINNSEVEELDITMNNEKLFNLLIKEFDNQDKEVAYEANKKLFFDDETSYKDFMWAIEHYKYSEIPVKVNKNILNLIKENNMINEMFIDEMKDYIDYNTEVWAIVDKIEIK